MRRETLRHYSDMNTCILRDALAHYLNYLAESDHHPAAYSPADVVMLADFYLNDHG
jgi:hypothetical protein